MATKLDSDVTYLDGQLLLIYSRDPCGLARSRDKLKAYLYYHNSYGHQTWQGDDIPWKDPTQKVKWFFNHVVFWGHATY